MLVPHFCGSQLHAGMKPLISILMPFKDAGPWLGECMRSILEQDFGTWELVAVDDHSRDDSMALVKAYASDDKRIIPLPNEGSGIIDALKTASRVMRGMYVTRMDADDIMPAGKLESLFLLASADHGCIATGQVEYFPRQSVSAGYREYERWINERCIHDDHWRWVYRECVICSANWMTHHSNADFGALAYPEDYSLVLHWYSKGLNVVSLPSVTHLWREHPLRTSRNSHDYSQDAFFTLKLNHFISHDLDPARTLLLLGNNRKTRLATSVLNQKGVSFQKVNIDDMSPFDHSQDPMVLVGVFPNPREREAIEALMEQKSLVMGQDWWWL